RVQGTGYREPEIATGTVTDDGCAQQGWRAISTVGVALNDGGGRDEGARSSYHKDDALPRG
ncbi:MAG: hypothetical protein ABSA94_07925, partial [Acidobacteriaceae bacterium]